MFGYVDINFDDIFELRLSTNTRGHKYKLFKKRAVQLPVAFVYLSTLRVVNRPMWNHLPSDVVKCNTLSAFEPTIA